LASKADHDCDLCGAPESYLDEVITDDQGGRMFVCSDTDFCQSRREAGHVGRLAPQPQSMEAAE
jgi:alpha-D-ribose 1-methylphosphonate 5-phosphate C-P lyase